MSLMMIIRPFIQLEEVKLLFITEVEKYYLRQANWTPEEIYFISEKFWENNKKPFGMEEVEKSFVEISQSMPVMIITDIKHANKLYERRILPVFLETNSLMSNYYRDTDGSLKSDLLVIKDDFLLGKEGYFYLNDNGYQLKPMPIYPEIERECIDDSKNGIFKIILSDSSNTVFERFRLS